MSPAPEDIRRLVSAQLGLPSVRDEDHLSRDLAADSADLLNIVASAEEDYGIEIGEEEAQGVETVGDLVALVRRRLEPDPR